MKQEEVERKKLEAAKVQPSEMFRIRTDDNGLPLYSKFDERVCVVSCGGDLGLALAVMLVAPLSDCLHGT